MPITRTLHYDYRVAPDALVALLRDPGYLARRCEADGDRNITVGTHERDEGLQLTVARDRTIVLPALVRGFIKPTNRTVETFVWRELQHGYQVDYDVQATGMPGTVHGSLRIVRAGSGTRCASTFAVEARVPWIGRKLEELVADGFEDYLRSNAAHDGHALGQPLGEVQREVLALSAPT